MYTDEGGGLCSVEFSKSESFRCSDAVSLDCINLVFAFSVIS